MMTETGDSAEETMAGVLAEMAGLRAALVEVVEAQFDGMTDRGDEVSEIAAAFAAVRERTANVLGAEEETCHDLTLSIEDREKYMKQIESLKTMRSTVVDLLELDKHVCHLKSLVDADFELEVQNIHAIAKEMVIVQSLISRSTETLQVQCMQVYKTIIRSLYEIKIQLQENIEKVWNSNVIINRADRNPYFNYADPSENIELIPTSKSITFGLDTDIMREIIYLMFQVELGYKHIKSMMNFISNELIYPTIENFPGFYLRTSIINNKITISLNSKDNDESSYWIDEANTLLDGLTDTLSVIHKDLICIANTDKDDALRRQLVNCIQKEYFDRSLTKALLSTFIPKISDIHQELSSKLCEFNDFLVKHQFIHHSNNSLQEYMDNFDAFHTESEAYNMLKYCRSMCLQSLLVFDNKLKSVSDLVEDIGHQNISEELTNFSKYFDLRSLRFPECNVSTSVISLVEIVTDYCECFDIEVENDYEKSTETLKMLPDILMMYHTVVPISNHEALKNIPQSAAIHYNNYMYIAHKAMIITPALKSLVESFSSKFVNDPHKQILLNNAPISMLSVIYAMRNAASDTLTSECNKQKDQLNEFFTEVDTFMNLATADQYAKIQKSLRKCHLYLHSLSQAYVVLPERIYEAFFGGFLIDHVLKLVVEKVLEMTDIVLNDNREIVVSITTFQTNLLSIISEHYRLQTDSEEKKDADLFMAEFVPNWERTKSLLFVLNGSLMEIDDRYLNGKGPLSSHFSGQELKGLIKALFKHGPLRTKILENIH